MYNRKFIGEYLKWYEYYNMCSLFCSSCKYKDCCTELVNLSRKIDNCLFDNGFLDK